MACCQMEAMGFRKVVIARNIDGPRVTSVLQNQVRENT